ncbi:S9 family peptidase [Paraglaciecola sp. MB-3u-78]|uniref:S9 family peptidase n=1 Tax=Paraglaciecola sp. MB-3u-78 TaxID=2058332 RepID=UPI001E46B8B9|nr:S9 family peptidase [Paraglaciecola sp. MB-3u-78]
MRIIHPKQFCGLLNPAMAQRFTNLSLLQAITWLMISIGLVTTPALAAQNNKKPSKQFTAERVFDMEYANDPQISPDGKTIVYVRQSMDKMTDQDAGKLWILDIKSATNRPLIADKNASSPRWSPDGKSLVFTSSHEGKPELRRVFIDSGMSFSLAQLHKGASGVVWSANGKQLAFSMFVEADKPSFATPLTPPKDAKWNKAFNVIDDMTFRFDGAGYLQDGASQIFTLPVGGGTPRQVTFEEAGLSSPQWLDNNQLLLTGNLAEDRDLDPIESEIYQLDLSDLKLSALTTRDGPDHSPIVSPDGKTIAFRGYDDKTLSYQQDDLYLIDADGSNVRPLAEKFAGSIGQTIWAPDAKSLLVLSEDHGVLSLFNISLRGKISKVVTNIGGTSIGRPYADGSFSVSNDKKPLIAFTAGFSDRPAEVGLVSLNGKNPEILTALNEDVLPYLDIAPIEEIKVKSSHDGLEIEAWVAFPTDFKADGTYPMILEIHGGPYAMYGPFFASEIQRYAAEGYVTVWVNPRGSTGYGEEFALAIDLAYPGYDYDDLMTVVDEVVAKKYADPERLFVTGGSGGGILTAWITTKTQRFAAAASIKPVINWMTMALAADIGQYVRRHWIRADPWADPEAFLKHSPIRYVDKVKTPTLLMVGEEDYRTPAWEAEQYYTALKMLKVDTALIRVPSAPHYIASRPSRLISKTDNIMGWFAKYDPAKQESSETESEDVSQ